jgi:hypothetical protein
MNKETTTCSYDGDIRQWNCQRDEQCDECFMADHLKECEWCTEYDHEERKLEVQHLASDFPSDAPSIDEMLAYIGRKTGFNPATMFSQVTEDENQVTEDENEGDRTAADYADAEPEVTE